MHTDSMVQKTVKRKHRKVGHGYRKVKKAKLMKAARAKLKRQRR